MRFKFPVEAFAKSAPVVLYGTGNVANQYMDQIEKMGAQDRVAFFVNTYPSEAKEFRGKPLMSLQQLQEQPNKQQWIFVVAAYIDTQSIVDTLLDMGIDDSRIVTPMAVEMGSNGVYYPLYRGTLKRIVVYPEINEDPVRNDLERRLDWYLPNRSDLNLFMTQNPITEDQWRQQLEACDLILVWNKVRLGDESLKGHKAKTACVDPEYPDTPEALIYSNLFYRTLDNKQKKQFLTQSIGNFERMGDQFKDIDIAYVFGTGPSLEQAWEMEFKPSIKIICNTIIKNPELIEKIGADIFVISDPLCVSYTDFGKEFRTRILDFLANKRRYCIVPEVYVPLFLAYFPEIKEQLIGIPVTSSSFNIPTVQAFTVKQTYNVITRLGLTTASALAKSVYILGCDGIPIMEDRGWEHSKSAPVVIKDDVQAAHVAYFSHDDSKVYYQRHYQFMEELLQLGERQGTVYWSLAPSYIPALARRQI